MTLSLEATDISSIKGYELKCIILLSRVSQETNHNNSAHLQYHGLPWPIIILCQRVNTATSSPANNVHHYVIPQKLLLTNRSYFQQIPVFMR
jgi:hypothetical protein